MDYFPIIQFTFPIDLNENVKNYLHACYTGDIEILKNCIELEPDIVKTIPLGLESACQENYIDVVKFLVTHGGADLKNENKGLIIIAAYYGYTDIVKYLVSLGARPNEANDTPIISATKNGHLDTVKYLVSMGADPYIDNCCNICLAITSENNELTKYFIKLGCDPSIYENVIMKFYCEKGNVEVVKFLVEFGVKPDNKYLTIASSRGHLDLMKYFIENGVKIQDHHNYTFLAAIKHDQHIALEFLLSKVELDMTELSNLLNYANNLKNTGFTEPVSCIAYLKEVLNIEDDFPKDFVVDSDDCPVCGECANLIIPCRHIICNRCFKRLREKTCPICRYSIDINLVKKRK